MNANGVLRSSTVTFTTLAVIACVGATFVKYASAADHWLPNPAPAAVASTLGAAKDLTEAQLASLPAAPEIGEPMLIWLAGVDAVDSATWEFGGLGCSGFSQSYTCTPGFGTDCLALAFRYASSGVKTVQVTVVRDGERVGPMSATIDVAGSGSCPTRCDSVAPPAASFSMTPNPAEAGQTVHFNDTTGNAMQLDRLFVAPIAWVENEGQPKREAAVEEPVLLTTVSSAVTVETEGISNERMWTISRDGHTVASSDERSFPFTFDEAGEYEVVLETANCAGSSRAVASLRVVEQRLSPVLVPGATHSATEKGSTWRTDLRVFNPGEEPVECRLEYLPEGQDNGELPTSGATFGIPARGTIRMKDAVAELCPTGSTCERGAGSIRLSFSKGDGTQPLVASRTYTETIAGSIGQRVPAVPVKRAETGVLSLCGVKNDEFSTSVLGIANLGDSVANDVRVTLLADDGTVLGTTTTTIPAASSVRLTAIGDNPTPAEVASLRIDGHGSSLTAYTSVVDVATGDPVLHEGSTHLDHRVLVPGVAHVDGSDGSRWRSDLSMHNPTDDWLRPWVVYVSEDARTERPAFRVNLPPAATVRVEDVLGFVGETASKGYLLVEGKLNNPVPLMALSTYDLAAGGGYGEGLTVFGAADLITADHIGFVPGVIVSEDMRSNLGLVNSSAVDFTTVDIAMLGSDGNPVGDQPHLVLAPGQFVQLDLAGDLSIPEGDRFGTVMLRVVEGGPIAAYASVIDNQTRDAMLIPAQPVAATSR